jgi:glucosamine--fructose-6-phosphate aminotransferase (isomerizing)
MKLPEAKYAAFSLTQEMLDTVDGVRHFDADKSKEVSAKIAAAGKLILTGEGSSRIFPAKNAMQKAMTPL